MDCGDDDRCTYIRRRREGSFGDVHGAFLFETGRTGKHWETVAPDEYLNDHRGGIGRRRCFDLITVRAALFNALLARLCEQKFPPGPFCEIRADPRPPFGFPESGSCDSRKFAHSPAYSSRLNANGETGEGAKGNAEIV